MQEKLQRQQKLVKKHKTKLPKINSTIVSSALLVLTHIAILLAIILSWRYYAIYPSVFGSVVAIIVCLLIIVDIIFFIGFNHKDKVLKIISSVLAIFLLLGGTVGTVYINKLNKAVDDVLDTKANEYETFSGVFVYYKKSGNNFTSLADLSGKKIGMLTENSNGLTYLATKLLDNEKIDYAAIDYKNNDGLMQALLDGDVDAIVITSGYRSIYEKDENSSFTKYLEDCVDFYSFEDKLKVETSKSSKNISKEPFNVLLIGYSRTDIGSPVGLADSIIVATINPQTYTVSMMSIARDSFVPIPCYGGESDKINSGRSTSRACFIETVENFIGMDIDYWMELDYYGLVAIVDTIGGIVVNNPVSFELDGTYVPAGDNVFLDGIMALQFCRERHHMPNGDFDRQQHQKEVIIKIAKKFIDSGDVSLALKAMEAASGNGDEEFRFLWTNFTLNELTSLFNLLLNTKNYTSLDTFDLVDFQTLRMTGYGGIMYYSMSMRLPLWVYLIYQGSYDESITHINEILGNYKTIDQEYTFEYSSKSPYVRPLFYSLEYENKFMYEPDPMPAYWADLEGMTLAEAMAWASSNGISLNVDYIDAGDSSYDASLEGYVVSQSPRYGALVSEYGSGSITVMGTGEIDESLLVPNMIGWKAREAKSWADENDVNWNSSNSTSGIVVSQSCQAKSLISACAVLTIEAEEKDVITVKANNDSYGTVSGGGTYANGSTITIEANAKDGFKFTQWDDGNTSSSRSIKVDGDATYTAIFELNHTHNYSVEVGTVSEATCTSPKIVEYKCDKCDDTTKKEVGEALGHNYEKGETVAPTCESSGYTIYTCSRCGNVEHRDETSALDHDWGEWTITKEATTSEEGSRTRTCNRDSSHTETESIPKIE